MLERVEKAGRSLRPARLLESLRERTKALHTQAERTGIVAEILHGRGTIAGYALLLRNLLPVYVTLEAELARHATAPVVGPIWRPELSRAKAIEADLDSLAGLTDVDLPVLPAALDYRSAITAAGAGSGHRLIAHAYTRYLGDLSGGQILKRLLARSIDLPEGALSFYDFPAILDLQSFKDDYRAAIERAGDDIDDFDAVVEEGARAFELNIALSLALLESVDARSRSGR